MEKKVNRRIFFAFGDQFTSGTHEYAVNFGQPTIDDHYRKSRC
jgi:hypothetical protein